MTRPACLCNRLFGFFFPRKHFPILQRDCQLQENVAFQVPLPSGTSRTRCHPRAAPAQRPSGSFTQTCSSSPDFPSWDFLSSFSYKQGSSHAVPGTRSQSHPARVSEPSELYAKIKPRAPKPSVMQNAMTPGAVAEIALTRARSWTTTTVDSEPPSSCPREAAMLFSQLKTFPEGKKKNHENLLNH